MYVKCSCISFSFLIYLKQKRRWYPIIYALHFHELLNYTFRSQALKNTWLNCRELESIRAKQEAVKETLEQLNRDFRNLEELIAKGKKCTVEEKRDSDDEEDDVESATVHCVTCGSDVQTRTAIRHMERCYNKVEGQTSFASRFKTQIDDERMFCDFYNSKEGTYCKR